MRETFSIVPASAAAAWSIGAIGLLLLGLLALFGYIAYSSRHVSFEVSGEGLRIRGDVYGRLVPLSSLDLPSARPIDLTREPGYRLKWRTNGTGLPGYAAGWFRLVNGEKCLAFLTDPHRAVYLPTREGYSVLLSCADTEGLLRALKNASRY